MDTIKYFEQRGCTFSGEVAGNGIYKFALPGEAREDGRLTVGRHGARVWHVSAKAGLDLGDPWKSAAPIRFGSRQIPSATAIPNDLTPNENPLRRKATEIAVARPTYSDKEISEAVGAILRGCGWEQQYQKADLEYWNDGTGSTAACRVHVGNGIASVWSHRSDVDLPPPFRPGRDTRDGHSTMYVTGRDLALESSGKAIIAPPPRRAAPASLNAETLALVRESWDAGIAPPADHPQLIKAGAQLEPSSLRKFPDNKQTRERHCSNDLIVPLFRPSGDRLSLELVGGQRLMARPWQGNDKLLLPGTSSAGALIPIPPEPIMKSGRLLDWMGSLGRHRVDGLPLVICEGVATGLAIHQSGAGNAICAVSSSNLPAVARWVKESGLADYFPAGVVIAADLDTSRDEAGRLKSNAISKAIEAAELVGGRVALAGICHKPGTDARDLLGEGGVQAVRDYIAEAVDPAAIKCRPDVLPLRAEHIQHEVGIAR